MIGRKWFSSGEASKPAVDGSSVPAASSLQSLLRFEPRPPSPQTAVDVFRGEWASNLDELLGVEGTGDSLLFSQDERPAQLAQAFGNNGSLEGMRILELGPLEAAHTYKLESLGASEIIAVEANVQAWLKCLVVKEMLGLKRSSFLLGDILKYFDTTSETFDIVMCSGILYHMMDPLALIENICKSTDRCFGWTHYYHRDRHLVEFSERRIRHGSFETSYWSHAYTPLQTGFWGGSASGACWMERDQILQAFAYFGLSKIEILNDGFDHPNGPSFTFTARR